MVSFGYSRIMFDEVSGAEGENNDKFFASYQVMPNMGVFLSLEDLSVVNTFIASSGTDGKINTYGIHYSLGIADIQLVYAEGDSDGAANQDYQTRSISAQMNLVRIQI